MFIQIACHRYPRKFRYRNEKTSKDLRPQRRHRVSEISANRGSPTGDPEDPRNTVITDYLRGRPISAARAATFRCCSRTPTSSRSATRWIGEAPSRQSLRRSDSRASAELLSRPISGGLNCVSPSASHSSRAARAGAYRWPSSKPTEFSVTVLMPELSHIGGS